MLYCLSKSGLVFVVVVLFIGTNILSSNAITVVEKEFFLCQRLMEIFSGKENGKKCNSCR